ncbi:MAG: hypothetical protein IJN65_05615 [Clostridia bacterium]|nr:hypothetical protein [Clostridia bacterium]
MKIETETPLFNAYKYRGLFEVVDRVQTEEQFLSESFIDEFSRCVSPQIAAVTGKTISQLKKMEASIWFIQDLNKYSIVSYGNIVFVKIMFLFQNASTFLYVACKYKDGRDFAPNVRDEINKDELDFYIVSSATLKEKETIFKWMLLQREECLQKGDTKRAKYLEETYYKDLQSYDFNDWRDWLIQRANSQDIDFGIKCKFKYEVLCGWPDVILTIVYSNAVNDSDYIKLDEVLGNFIAKWNKKHQKSNNNKVIHDYMKCNASKSKNRIRYSIDFGNSDPDIVLPELLIALNKNILGIEKVMFT